MEIWFSFFFLSGLVQSVKWLLNTQFEHYIGKTDLGNYSLNSVRFLGGFLENVEVTWSMLFFKNYIKTFDITRTCIVSELINKCINKC